MTLVRQFRLCCVLALLFGLWSWWSSGSQWRTEPVSQNLVPEQTLLNADAWRVVSPNTVLSEQANGLTLLSDTANRVAAVLALPSIPDTSDTQGTLYRIQVQFQRDYSQNTSELLTKRSMFAARYREAGELNRYVTAFRIYDAMQSAQVDEIVTVDAGASQFELVWVSNPTSQWFLTSMNIDKVQLSSRNRILILVTVIAWTVLLIWWVAIFYQARLGWYVLASGFVLLMMLTGVMANRTFLLSIYAVIQPWLEQSSTVLGTLSINGLMDLGHIIGFALLTLAIYPLILKLNCSSIWLVPAVAGIALGTEAIQRHIPSRSAQLADVVNDLIGLLIGMLLAILSVWGWRMLRKRTV